MRENHKNRWKVANARKREDYVGRALAKKGLVLLMLAGLFNVGMASYLCDGIEHPRTVDAGDVKVIRGDGKVTIILEGNYDVIMPSGSLHWQSRSMGWSMAPGYMYIVNYDEPELNDITAFSNGKFGVSHQLSNMNGTLETKSIFGTTEEGWTDENYLYKYAGALFIK
ncbi:MAG: hypothetical protein ABII71_04635 [Candidatus Micrarchaeota archaeon]